MYEKRSPVLSVSPPKNNLPVISDLKTYLAIQFCIADVCSMKLHDKPFRLLSDPKFSENMHDVINKYFTVNYNGEK